MSKKSQVSKRPFTEVSSDDEDSQLSPADSDASDSENSEDSEVYHPPGTPPDADMEVEEDEGDETAPEMKSKRVISIPAQGRRRSRNTPSKTAPPRGHSSHGRKPANERDDEDFVHIGNNKLRVDTEGWRNITEGGVEFPVFDIDNHDLLYMPVAQPKRIKAELLRSYSHIMKHSNSGICLLCCTHQTNLVQHLVCQHVNQDNLTAKEVQDKAKEIRDNMRQTLSLLQFRQSQNFAQSKNDLKLLLKNVDPQVTNQVIEIMESNTVSRKRTLKMASRAPLRAAPPDVAVSSASVQSPAIPATIPVPPPLPATAPTTASASRPPTPAFVPPPSPATPKKTPRMADEGANRECIKLKIVGQDANEVNFLIKFATAMGKLKKSFAHRAGVAPSSLRFMFDGRRIADEDTPKSLEMEEDDVIEVYHEQLGGF